ncbi:MAG: LytTR family transcriptional regulator DNA-binding domain-containing protein [Alphaproteobacteria bacterium]|nr:LytTR family transcriptional regulator DNA-binding domain-containing protein [Alphaproteobacteria bacterium]
MTRPVPFLGTPREWAIDLAIAGAIGAFLGVIGPFGTYEAAGAPLRIAYWIGNLWIGFGVLSLTARLAVRMAERLDLPVWFALGLAIAVGALPLTLILRLYSALIWPPNHGLTGPFFGTYVQVLILSEPLAFVFFYLMDQRWSLATGRPDGPPRAEARLADPPPTTTGPTGAGIFLDRLPARLGRELLCLRMEDHYVRAHTTRGSDLILIPLKVAVAELEGVEGLQVHRSWWVARGAVARSRLRGRQVVLELTNGLEAPVSRAAVARLKAAGWISTG